jgi:two-component system LytT family response regulator
MPIRRIPCYQSSHAGARKKSLDGAGETPVAERARAALETREPFSRIFVRDRGRIIPIAVDGIDRLEAEDDYVGVHSGGKRYLVYLKMSEFEALLDPQRFMRIHRSHIVNLDKVAVFFLRRAAGWSSK